MKNVRHFGFMRAALVFCFVLASALSFVQAQTAEDGTEAHPFLIDSKQELLDFADCMATNADFYYNGSTFVTTNGSGFIKIKAGGTLEGGIRAFFRLTTDIVLNTGMVAACECDCSSGSSFDNWTPIASFNGCFDGGYHIISGLYCKHPGGYQIGFFKEVSNGEVRNLGIVNSYIEGARYLGGIAGEILDHSTISHCFYWGTIESTGDICGGITGQSMESSLVRDCYATGNLHTANYYAGNIVGYNRESATLASCYSSMWSSSEDGYFGAICGRNEGIITNCYYDKQMTPTGNNLGTSKLTSELVSSSFTSLGTAFVASSSYYPTLTGFDYDHNQAALLSVVPLFLHANSSTSFDDVDNIRTDFTVGVPTGAVWSISSWNDAGTFNAPNEVHLNRHGIVDLSITLEGISRLWGLTPKLWPYLGTESNPFTIDNLDEFAQFRDGINSGLRFKYKCIWVYPNELDTIHWLQTFDWDMTGVEEYAPCGTVEHPFRGYYDGGHHTVSNLTISGSNSNVGFFGSTRRANIRNLNFVNPSISGYKNISVLCGHSYANLVVDSCTVSGGTVISRDTACGAICGRAYYTSSYPNTSLFSHCLVENTTMTGAAFTGGICGGSLSGRVRFSECSVRNTSITGTYCVGGICSYVYNYSSIKQCSLEGGSVTATNTSNSYYSYAGGICSYMAGNDTVSNCTVTGTMVRGASQYVGGICSYMSTSTISDCTTLGDATVTGTSSVGGICGHVYNTSYITNCTSRAKAVTGTGNGVAGICGYQDYSSYLYIRHCKNYSSVKGVSSVGGIYGGNGGNSSYSSRHTIEYCYNAGHIELTGSVGGGIAGNTATVNYCINTGVVKGGSYVGGIGGGGSTSSVSVYYSMNTADVYCANYGGGISFYGTSSNCVNYGNVIPLNLNTAGITEYGISSNASYSFNVGRIWGIENARTSGNNSSNVYYDSDFVGDQYSKADGIGLEQSQMIGTSSSMSSLSSSYWLFEVGRYPRLKWTNNYDWARDVAIAASQPVLLATEAEDANSVKQGVKLYGCNEGVTWRLLPPAAGELGGCIFSNNIESLACMGNAITPTVTTGECKGFSTVAAVLNDSIIKRVMLRINVPAPHDTLTIDNLEELQAFRDSINSGEPFHWKGYYVPRFAVQTCFKLTDDITMPISSWTPIGNNYTVFRGHFAGGSHTITGLRGGGVYAGLFCHVNGIVRDLNFTDVSLTGSDGSFRGTVCSYLRDGKILNCTASGTVASAIGGGIVGWSDGKDTIMNCVNNCTVVYSNPGSTVNYPPSIGGILGLGSGRTYISNCKNNVNIDIINNHDNNYRSTAGGIVGAVGNHNYTTGRVTTINCSNEGSIKANYAGGIIGRGNIGSIATHCTNKGDIECGFYSNESNHYYGGGGGIIGYGGNLVVSHCTNEGNLKYVEAGSYYGGGVGGIIGQGIYYYSDYSDFFYDYETYHYENNVVEYSTNAGNVEGLDVAGITCRGAARHCANYGEVKGLNTCSYVAGVCAQGTADSCYNVGTVTALAGSSVTERYVGGVCASGSAAYSYNAGQVFGFNSKYVGGIVGVGNVTYCYNSNTVRSSGTYLGSIVGKQGSLPSTNSYYDKQMSPFGAVNGEDNNTNHVEGRSTTDMIGTGLQGRIGNNNVWTYTADLYPQLMEFANTPPSLSSVMPVLLQNDETALQAYHSFYMKGCDIGEWHILQGASLRLDTASQYHQCEGSVVGMGIVKLGAAVDGRIYRQDRILIGISEDAPYIVKNLTEMRNFRDVINEDGYYNMADSTFHLSLTNDDSTHIDDFAEIQNGGLDLFFKLVTDLDMSTEYNWIPVGAYNTDEENANRVFQGTFMGDNHTIRHLTIAVGDYKGLFGRNSTGEIRNLNISESKIIGSGYCRALLCASNFGGWIKNCAVTNSKLNVFGAGESTEQPVGLVCGINEFATILNSRVANDTIRGNNVSTVGGICGMQKNAVIDTCYADKLMVSGKTHYFGSMCGQNNTSAVLNSSLTDALLNMDGNNIGGICGYNYQSSGANGVHNCTSTRSAVQGMGNYYGGISGRDYYGHIKGCSLSGGTTSVTGSYVGGVVGYKNYSNNVDYSVEHCTNENPVSAISTAGGICGYVEYDCRIIACINRGTITTTENAAGGIIGSVYRSSRMDSCGNYGYVYAKNYAGGLVGSQTYDYYNFYIYDSYNRGNVAATQNYAGGIIGSARYYTYIERCYNTGNTSAGGDYAGGIAGYLQSSSHITNSFNSGNVTGRNCVGGIAGHLLSTYAQYCYNAGIVKGMSQVGGLIGYLQSPSTNTMYNYNVAWVEGVSMVGSICGYTTDQSRLTNNAYDYQMCFFKPVSNNDHSGSQAMLTSQMLGNGLQSVLNGTTNWTYASGMYPRVKAWENDNASIASVSPVLLPVTASDTLTANGLPANTYTNVLGNCGTVTWVRAEGYTLSVNGCSFTGTAAERVRLATVIDGDTFKQVQLLINISLQDSLEITDRIQLKKFRDLINSGQTFFYDPVRKEFRESESTFYLEVPPYGDRTYFILMSDIDLSLELEDWRPVGDFGSSLASRKVNMRNGTTPMDSGAVIAFYDDGGPNENYSASQTLTHTFTTTGNNRIRISFTMVEGEHWDYIGIYDGSSTSSPVLLTYNYGSMTNLAGKTFTSTGPSLTVRFYSNGSNEYAGWEAVVWTVR